ncbi:MAG: ABC transporter permease [Polyangiaceae bacterium]|nr:ABC transporter permease [Polyangiaceae bacterium]
MSVSPPGDISAPERYSPLAELIKTRLREFFREPGMVFWVFALPVLMAVGLGLAFHTREPELPRIAIVNQGPMGLSQALTTATNLNATLTNEAEARRGLRRAKFDLVVDLGGALPVLTRDPAQARSALAQIRTEDALQRAAGRQDTLQFKVKSVLAPGNRYMDFLLPGLIGLNVMGSSLWSVGFNLVVARKRKLLRRYAVTPMLRWQFLTSYFCARSVFLIAEMSVLLVVGALFFGTILQGSLLAFALLAAAGAASFASISLFVGSRLDNTEVANGWVSAVQLPMWILSGVFFSYERFPEWLHGPIQLLPLTALNDALRAIFNEGAGLLAVGPQLAVLLAWGAAGFIFALKRFRWG